MRAVESRDVRHIVGRLNRHDRLPQDLLAVAKKFGVKAGRVHAIGGVTTLAVTEFDVETQKYREPLRRTGMTEVLGLAGNLSLRAGELFGHLHISACYEENGATKMLAGHLVEAEVFVCEYHIVAYDDIELTRELDPQTGLALWNLPDKE